jgi:hypothetical protein
VGGGMRYTEKEHDYELKDLLDFIRFVLLSFFFAPKRLIEEISNKLMYLGKEAVEKLALCMIIFESVLLLLDGILYLATGKVEILTGFSPVLVKFIVLVLTGLGSLHILKKFDYVQDLNLAATSDHVSAEDSISEDTEEEEVAVSVQEEIPETEGLSFEGYETSDTSDAQVPLDFDLGLPQAPVRTEMVMSTPEEDDDWGSEELVEGYDYFNSIDPKSLLASLDRREPMLGGNRPPLFETLEDTTVKGILTINKIWEENK